MTSTLTYRAAFADIGIRAGDGGDGRTVYGIAVPFDREIEIFDWWDGEYMESFARGAFAKTIGERGDKVKFLGQHDRRNNFPLGKATTLREDPAGLFAEFHVSKTQRGDELLELVRDGAVDSLSIGFIPIGESKTKGDDGKVHIQRTEVSLREVSAVTFAAYDGDATIDGVRSADPLSALSAVEQALRTGRPVPEAALAALDALRGTQGREQGIEPEPPAVAPELNAAALARRAAERLAMDRERVRLLATTSR